MKLTMLKISVPVLMLSLFQSGYGAGIRFDRLSEVATLAAQGRFAKAGEKLYEYTEGDVSVYNASEVPEEVKAAAGILDSDSDKMEKYKASALDIIGNNVPDFYKNNTDYKNELFEALLAKVNKDTALDQITDKEINPVIQEHKNKLVSDFYNKYWKVNAQISGAIQAWEDEIRNWDPDDDDEVNKGIFKKVITDGVQMKEDELFGVEEYFKIVNFVDYDPRNPGDSAEKDKDGESRAEKAYAVLVTNYENRVTDDAYADRALLRQYLMAYLKRNVNSDENAYGQMVDDIIANQPDVENLRDMVDEFFGKHFADFIGSSTNAPANGWQAWIEGVDEAVNNESKREEAVADFFKPLSNQDAADLVEKLILIKRNTK